MITILPLKEMTLSEKFLTIEEVWDDISHTSKDFSSPKWHEEELIKRDSKIAAGEDELIN